ncbi:transcription initiation protein SPT3 homolog isoform X2 [Rhipicephalus sanguineus]|uniref:transcription initiation protein SPT3 homolog isoform X2 n=1 Tax=Rhipicephalus sanguineus TaxID=34632 RepID=UPI0020C37940|nr:transcription initiation protein SPT3 homolog isoform X2 [Rhipicephalus sanguineus]
MAKENQASLKNSKFKSKPKKPNRDKEPSSSSSSNENKAPSGGADTGSSAVTVAASKPSASSSGSSSGGAGSSSAASSSSAAASSSSSPQNAWVLDEIRGMMHGFGDSSEPLLESVTLVEDIVTQQIKCVLHRAAEVAMLRGSKSVAIEDILFLMRKDKFKLGRLVRYLELKSLQGYIYSKLPTDDEEASTASLASVESALADVKPEGGPQFKRTKICREFISFIDQTGELEDAFNESAFDEVKHEREMRLEAHTRTMDQTQYMEYSNARASSFCRKHKSARFREWVMKDIDSDMKLSSSVLDVFSYLAYETVAQIVDLALLIKKESKHDPSDPLTWSMPPLAGNPGFPSTQFFSFQDKPWFQSSEGATSKSGDGIKKALLPSECIKPEEIREAMHRYMTRRGPMASFAKPQVQGACRHLLCC